MVNIQDAQQSQFFNVDTPIDAPATHAFAIVPSDDTDLEASVRGLYLGASGDLKVDMLGGEAVTFVGLAAGVIHPLRAKKVYETGTTATGIIGVY